MSDTLRIQRNACWMTIAALACMFFDPGTIVALCAGVVVGSGTYYWFIERKRP